jgi:TatD DNase family protein
LTQKVRQHNPVAIGETGLDLFVSKNNIDVQEYYFSEQLRIASEFDLPVIMHVRSAIDLILKHLRRVEVRGGIAHAFNGSFQQAEQLIERGFKLGFGGAMTNPRATHLQDLAKSLPINSIVLETDAPDMPPFWLQGKAYNQPSEVVRIAQFFADLRGLNSLELADIIRANTWQALPKLAKLCT